MKCDVCSKRYLRAHKVSHSNIKTKRRQNANVQRVHALVGGRHALLHACTRCIRSGKVKKLG